MPSDLIRGWVPVFPRDKREAFARRSCSNKKIERDDDSKKSHPALDVANATFNLDPHLGDLRDMWRDPGSPFRRYLRSRLHGNREAGKSAA
jgi:hypothetical protein